MAEQREHEAQTAGRAARGGASRDGALAVEADGLVKHFTTGKRVTKAVDGVDLRIAEGSVFGLLGPNGAGKTTIVRMLATLLRPDSGSARVLGHDVVHDADAVRSAVGLTGQYASVDEDLTGTENLMMLARLYGFAGEAARVRIAALLEAFGLADAGARQVKTYSGGMRRRIDLAASLVLAPRVLFLDEPTTGLDPRSRNQVWDIVRVLVADGATVLLTTQYLEEADQLADRIAVVDHGRIIAEGTSSELKRSVGQGAVTMRLADASQRAAAAAVVERLLGTQPTLPADPYALTARVPDDGAPAVARLLPALGEEGIVVPEFSLGQPSLDEVFLTITGKPLPDGGDDAAGNGGPGAADHTATVSEEVSR
ncbi:daunorubicin resistance ABC transporter ATPase subunit [Beutenbergia cavernae DSM 12333]|uniref:Daunorubicin resistance ABC transporter ATPase subunit n=1 Tax=Beutenbergia cavernae (strain ATCC BAA-8 / DSM 12333 / CCUG 43141 / JCM 11478 / NBRC 16432 / NCIMB 13614 / HKI 0122) TaxID=471853 RepID=C5C1M7_BEUC1|nr:daunorubicin/doxorubicin resistance ABC transporter ATP-binding protein DrrA [Beutenbergia cavernae]ACQ79495.1 daunorubicin resistance ABC transporter ATPase subunit [Beutenbergia cavernae DSM 12333]